MDIQEHVNSILWRDLERIRERHAIPEEQFSKGVFLLMIVFGASHSYFNEESALVPLPIHHTRAFEEFLKTARAFVSDDDAIGKIMAVLDEICSSLGIASWQSGQEWLSFLAPALRSLFDLFNSMSEGKIFDWLRFVDSAYLHTIPSKPASIERATLQAIEVGLNFLPQRLEIMEYFSGNANFTVRAAQQTKRDVSLTLLPPSPQVRFDLLALRLALQNIRVFDTSRGEIERPTFIFISHPNHFVSRKRKKDDFFWVTQGDIQSSNNQSALEGIAAAIRYPVEIGVAAIPINESYATGWKLNLRRHLITEGRLLAVIGGLGLKKNEKKISHWIFSGRTKAHNGVLFINLESIAREGKLDTESMLKFASKIVRRAYPSLDSTLTGVEDSEQYNGLWSRHFESGYQDVNDICRLVRQDEFDEMWSLDIGKYVSPPRKAQHMLRLLDSRQVMEVIAPQRTPQRAYIIGPNGKGKSLLLAQLAEELSDQQIRTAGIAFGLTDRFVFNAQLPANERFSYLGARTSDTAISLPATRRIIENCIRRIASLSKRLNAFRTSMQELGFGHLYVIPSGLKIHDDLIPEEKIAKIIELTRSDLDDESVGMPAKFSLAVVRRDSGNHIVPLEKLSSGEQQLITLVAKISAYAEPGWVMLIDEPEISLHVSWQRAIPLVLANLSKELQCSIVVATHSPVLFASALPDDYCFTADNQVCRLLDRNKRVSVESSLFDDFGTYTPNTRRVHELCAAAVANTMRTLNSEQGDVFEHSAEAELGKLEKVSRFVDSSPQNNSDWRARDIDLIRKTRLAITELLLQRDSNADSNGGDI